MTTRPFILYFIILQLFANLNHIIAQQFQHHQPPPLSPAQLETLKTVTLQKASLDAINVENIPQLVRLIENQTQYRLHPLTLQRFYGLVPAKFGPSYLAITALCNFCGYREPTLIPPFLIVMNNLQ